MTIASVEEWRLFVQIAEFLLMSCIGFYTYMSNKNKVTNDRINDFERDVDDKFDSHSSRIAMLEAHLSHVPTQDDLGGLHEKVNEVAGAVRELKGEFYQVSHTVNLIHETLMERK